MEGGITGGMVDPVIPIWRAEGRSTSTKSFCMLIYISARDVDERLNV